MSWIGQSAFVLLLISLAVWPSSAWSGGGRLDAQRLEALSRLFPEHRSGIRLDLLEETGDFPVNRSGELVVSTGPYLGTPAELEGDERTPLARQAKEAELAVVGVVQSRQSHLTRNGEFVFSVYRLAVEKTLKGSAPAGSEILFVAPGGSIQRGGRRIRVHDTVFKPFQIGSRYVLLLKAASQGVYIAACAGSYQLFEDFVRTTAWGTEFQEAMAGRTPEEFLSEVQEFIIQ